MNRSHRLVAVVETAIGEPVEGRDFGSMPDSPRGRNHLVAGESESDPARAEVRAEEAGMLP